MRRRALVFGFAGGVIAGLGVVACSSDSPSTGGVAGNADASTDAAVVVDAVAIDAQAEDANEAFDAGPDGSCFITTYGVYGTCMTTSDCTALGAYSSTPGFCPGAADNQCCSKTPNVADNPPPPAGWRLMTQPEVTADMTTWAVTILHDPFTYPMFSTTTKTFPPLVLARVEWHPPDMNNETVHRGVTLYVQQ